MTEKMIAVGVAVVMFAVIAAVNWVTRKVTLSEKQQETRFYFQP